MASGREHGLVVAKAPTGPQPVKVRRTPIAKSRPIPKRELYNRLVRTRQPPPKRVRAPAERKNLHPQGLEKSLAVLEKRRNQQQDTHVAPKWDDIYDPSRPNLYQDYNGSDEQKKEKLEWKARLYAHRAAQGQDGAPLDRRGQGGAELGDSKER